MTSFSSGWVCAVAALLGCVIAACGSGPAEAPDAGGGASAGDAGPDAAVVGAGGTNAGGADAGSTDAGSADAGDAMAERCAEFCMLFQCADRSLCDGAVPLEPGVPRTMQDSASGGHAECARTGSGVGGPSLYYRLTLPAAQFSRVMVKPIDPAQHALLRVLTDCDATEAEWAVRGGAITDGAAELCIRNDGSADRTVILAVSRYSGEAMDVPIVFDLSVEIIGLELDCPP